MDTRVFHSTLETHGLAREVSDAIVHLVEDSRTSFVTNDKLELELTKLRAELREEMSELRGELRGEMAQLRTDFAEHKLHTTRLALGTSGALGFLMIMLRFLPA